MAWPPPPGEAVQHRGLDLLEAALVEVGAQVPDQPAAHPQQAPGVGVDDQVDVALAEPDLGVLEPVPLVRQRPQRLGEKRQLGHVEADLAAPGAKDLAGGADNVSQVEVVEARHRLIAQRVVAGVELDLAAAVDEVGKGSLALAAVARDPAGNRHRPQPRVLVAARLLLGFEVRDRVGGEVAAVEAERERLDAMATQGLELADPLLAELFATGRGRGRVSFQVHGRED